MFQEPKSSDFAAKLVNCQVVFFLFRLAIEKEICHLTRMQFGPYRWRALLWMWTAALLITVGCSEQNENVAPRKHVFLIVVDTLRYDRVGVHGK